MSIKKPVVETIKPKTAKILDKIIHVVAPFSRHELKDALINHFKHMDIIWHPVMFKDEAKITLFDKPWIVPFIIPEHSPEPDMVVGQIKLNRFKKAAGIVDNDYYVVCSDLTGFEPDVFKKIKQMNDDVIFISLKRGYQIPIGLPSARAYGINTLIAHPNHVAIGCISGEQCIMKGHIFKQHLYNETSRTADGEMAMLLKEKYEVRYEINLYALFHYFEEGRWNG